MLRVAIGRENLQPFLKWAGSKRALAPLLAPQLSAHLARTSGSCYVEPFLGSGAVFFQLDPDRARLNDACAPLMEVYRALRDSAAGVAAGLQSLLSTHGMSQPGYLSVRAARYGTIEMRAARFIYLNKTCFNGLYRENKSGIFNVPWGGDRNPEWPDANTLEAYGRRLSKAVIGCGDFRAALLDLKPGDVVYADPPYHDVYASYVAGGFGEKDQMDLAGQLKHLASVGVVVYASNSDTELIRKLYSWAQIESLSEARVIAAAGDKRKAAATVLIRGGIK